MASKKVYIKTYKEFLKETVHYKVNADKINVLTYDKKGKLSEAKVFKRLTKEEKKLAKKYASGKKNFMTRMMEAQSEAMKQREDYAEKSKDMSRSELSEHNRNTLREARKRMAEKYGDDYEDKD